MKKYHYGLCAIVISAFAYACTPKATTAIATTPSVPETPKVTTPTVKNVVTPDGQRKFIDPTNINLTARPQDDFYEYANGAWLAKTAIPASESRWGSFNELREFNKKALKDICNELAASPGEKGSLSQKVGDFYAAGMDSVAIEKAGMTPLKPYLARIDAVKNFVGLLEEIALESTEGSNPIFGVGVGIDAKNSTVYAPNVGAGGMHLPDRDLYLKDDERSKKIRKAYEEHVVALFKLAGSTDMQAKQAFADVMRMETAFAKATLSRVERRDPEKTYNKMTLVELEKVCPRMNWAEYFKATKMTNPYYIVRQPNFLKELHEMLGREKLDDWKTFLKWDAIKSAAPYLSNAFVAENFKFTQNITGQKEMQPRWKQVSEMTDNVLGEALGKVYVDRHFKPEAKTRMLELVGNLMKTYDKRIRALDWMSEETKTKALEKLSTFVRKIGYTDKWTDYTPLSIDRSKSYFANLWAASKFLTAQNVAYLGKPIDREKWGMTPPTVNAYYNPTMNEIVFPAGILQFPFFDNSADDAVNYGGIGAVIGHEISHGFDDQGAKFDKDGNLKNWWTEEDIKKFQVKTNMVVEQYNNYKVLDTLSVNGKLTLGENIADLGGLSVAFDAFKNYSAQGKSTETIDGFTADQRFFLSWAQVWRAKMRPEAEANQIQTDPHSPGKFRCNGPLTNMMEFYNIFGVKQGDKMWRPEAERAKIW
ncbi:MAG: M13 family metallopeptidase [Saprospiraceae bacterium]|nr:M13 family metallopeptidase [Saprospiraceae bacterium]